MMEGICTYIHPGGNKSYHNDGRDGRALHLHPYRWEHILPQSWKGSTLTFIQARTHSTTMMKVLALIYDLVGTNPIVISEWPLVLN